MDARFRLLAGSEEITHLAKPLTDAKFVPHSSADREALL